MNARLAPRASGRTRTIFPLLATLALGAGLSPSLAAQGGLRWSDPAVQPVLHVRENADRTWWLCFDGWSMTGGTPFLNDSEAAGIGVDPGAHSVRTSSCDVLRGDQGGTARLDLFPFVEDQRVVPIFSPSAPTLTWWGLLAPITGPVPDAGMGALAFRVQLSAPLPAAIVVPLFANTRAGVALANAQGAAVGTVFVVAPSRVQMASIAYFKFDRRAGLETINYAGIEGGARSVAILARPNGSPWTRGRFGGGLRARAVADTGFRGDLGGRFTVGWFMRGSTAPSGPSPVFGLDNWACYTGGAAGTGLRCSGWGGTPNDLDLNVDVQALAANGWVHIALEIDSDQASTAKWYVNGALRRTIPISGRVRIPPSGNTLAVGAANGNRSAYDLDEFRLDADAVGAATIARWASSSSEAGQPFGMTCGANLRQVGTPTPGAALVYRIESAPAGLASLSLGTGARWAGRSLPVDLGMLSPQLAGCPWYVNFMVNLPAARVPPLGIVVRQVPLPNSPTLRGIEIYAQSLVVSPSGPRASNPHVVSIE